MLSLSRTNPLKGLLLRRYATFPKPEDKNHRDDMWPSTKTPTPYEVFGVPPGSINPNDLKKKYHALAKLYHPDISNNITILTTKPHHHTDITGDSPTLTTGDKLYRFKVLNEAYDLLTDSRRKGIYDRYKTGWSHGPVAFSSHVSPYASSNAGATSNGYHSNSDYWNAGTWEDVNNLGKTDQKKISVWMILAWMCGLFVCVEFTALLTRIEETINQKNFTHDETEKDLTQAYINYGLDTDKWSRLRRFLWFRTFGLYKSKADLDREAKKNEELVQFLKSKAENE